jgi:hypothetical protein
MYIYSLLCVFLNVERNDLFTGKGDENYYFASLFFSLLILYQSFDSNIIIQSISTGSQHLIGWCYLRELKIDNYVQLFTHLAYFYKCSIEMSAIILHWHIFINT